MQQYKIRNMTHINNKLYLLQLSSTMLCHLVIMIIKQFVYLIVKKKYICYKCC